MNLNDLMIKIGQNLQLETPTGFRVLCTRVNFPCFPGIINSHHFVWSEARHFLRQARISLWKRKTTTTTPEERNFASWGSCQSGDPVEDAPARHLSLGTTISILLGTPVVCWVISWDLKNLLCIWSCFLRRGECTKKSERGYDALHMLWIYCTSK